MKLFFTVLIVLLSCCEFVCAQPDPQTLWSRVHDLSFQYDLGLSVCSSANGRFAVTGVTGFTLDNQLCNGIMLLLNGDGDTVRVVRFPGTPWLAIDGIQSTSDGGFILAGSTKVDNSTDALLIKTDSTGQVQWTHLYGYAEVPERFVTVQGLSDGGFICAGIGNSFVDASIEFYLVKTNASGDTIWTKTYGTEFTDFANGVELCSDGGFLLAGYSSANNHDIFIVKVNSLGEIEWTKTVGGEGEDYATGAFETSDGGYLVYGSSSSFNTLGNMRNYLMKIDRSGDTLWTASPGASGDYFAEGFIKSDDGNYLLTGCFYPDDNNASDAYLIKIDDAGNILWSRRYLSDNQFFEYGYDLCKTPDGGYVLTGSQAPDAVGSNCNVLVARTGPEITPVENSRAGAIPDNYALAAYPNPFNPATTLALTIPASGNVTLAIYDVLGHQTQTIADHEFYAAGVYEFVWNASSLPSGVYLAQLTYNEHSLTKKLLLLK